MAIVTEEITVINVFAKNILVKLILINIVPQKIGIKLVVDVLLVFTVKETNICK
jgi:hypothetical protein